MRTLRLKKEQIHRGSLILVNRDNPLQREVGEKDLRTFSGGIKLEKEAAAQLEVLLGESREIISVSGFRSRREQAELYQNCLRKNGEVFTKRYVAPPCCSEHESGLAVDLGENREPVDFIRPSFPYQGSCQEFRRKAPFFGFVQRYDSGKERVTGIAHEPWHFRYVGFPHSLIMNEKQLSLEEYLSMIREKEKLRWQCGSRTMEIHYVAADSKNEILVELPEDRPYQVSGDNVGGVVVTLL